MKRFRFSRDEKAASIDGVQDVSSGESGDSSSQFASAYLEIGIIEPIGCIGDL